MNHSLPSLQAADIHHEAIIDAIFIVSVTNSIGATATTTAIVVVKAENSISVIDSRLACWDSKMDHLQMHPIIFNQAMWRVAYATFTAIV